MMTNCPVCGKRFVVCWPDLWPYRRRSKLFCREACLVVYTGQEFRDRVQWMEDNRRRKKEEEKVGKITLEQKKKAVSIAISGGDPMKFLKECGSKNPSAHWYYIKKTLKEKDKVLYDKIPDRFLDKAQEEPKVDLTIDSMELAETDVEQESSLDGFVPFEIKDGRRHSVATCCAPSTREGVEVPDELPEFKQYIGRSAEILEKCLEKEPVKPEVVLTIKSEDLTKELNETPNGSSITKPVNYDGFEVLAFKSPDTGFRFTSDPRYGMMTWNTISGDEVSLTAEEWHKLAAELPKVLQIFGI